MTEMAWRRTRVIPWGRLYDIYDLVWKYARPIMERLGLGLLVNDVMRLTSDRRREIATVLTAILTVTFVLTIIGHEEIAIVVLLIGLLFWRVSFLSPLKEKPYIVDEFGWPLAENPYYMNREKGKGSHAIVRKLNRSHSRGRVPQHKIRSIGNRPEPSLTGPLKRWPDHRPLSEGSNDVS